MLIALLEADDRRTEGMLRFLGEAFPGSDCVVFDNAPDMIRWFPDHLVAVRLLCLDHDLGPCSIRSGDAFDPGCGRDVADYLAAHLFVVPW